MYHFLLHYSRISFVYKVKVEAKSLAIRRARSFLGLTYFENKYKKGSHAVMWSFWYEPQTSNTFFSEPFYNSLHLTFTPTNHVCGFLSCYPDQVTNEPQINLNSTSFDKALYHVVGVVLCNADMSDCMVAPFPK